MSIKNTKIWYFRSRCRWIIIATTIYYDKDKREDVFNFRYKINELNHFPIYEEIKKNYKDKIEIGIHFARVEPQPGQHYKTEEKIITAKRKGKSIGNEYIITEKEQMLPLYILFEKKWIFRSLERSKFLRRKKTL